MRAELLTRYELQSWVNGDFGITHMNVLLDDTKLNHGTIVSLKDDEADMLWKVVAIGETIPAASINRGWNNNI